MEMNKYLINLNNLSFNTIYNELYFAFYQLICEPGPRRSRQTLSPKVFVFLRHPAHQPLQNIPKCVSDSA